MQEKKKIEISLTSMLKFFFVILALMLVYFLRDVIGMLFVVFIVVAALDPIVSWTEKYGLPRWFTIAFIYLLVVSVVGLAIYLVFPPLIEQVAKLANEFPTYIAKITPLYTRFSNHFTNWQSILSSLSKDLTNLSNGFYSATVAFFGGVVSFVTILIISFYALLDRSGMKKTLINWFPKDEARKKVFVEIFKKIASKMGAWLRGQILISLIIGFATTILLLALGNPYALTIGFIGALVEILPIIGPVITATFAILTCLGTGGWVIALIALAGFTLIQQLEAHFIVPKVMSKAVNMSPVVIIIALLVGGRLAGIPGAILAIPAAAGISVFIQDYPKIAKTEKLD